MPPLKVTSFCCSFCKRKCEEELREGYKNIMEYLKENRDEYYNLPRKEKKQFKKLLDVLFPKEVRK